MKTPDVKLDKALSELLTPREGEVLIALAQGFTNREIAAELEIGVKTVDSHRAKTLKKLKLRNNSDLTRFAIKLGFIDVDGNELARIPSDPVETTARPDPSGAPAEDGDGSVPCRMKPSLGID